MIIVETIVKTRICAYAVIIKEGKIALMKKAGGAYKGKYDLPGGEIKHNETPVETLKRGLMEEIGCTMRELILFDATSVTFKWQTEENVMEDLHHIGLLYIVKIKENDIKKEADGLDSDGAAWIDIDTLTEDKVTPFVWHALKRLL